MSKLTPAKTRKSAKVEYTPSESLMKAMQAANQRIAKVASADAARTGQVQREAEKAVAETMTAWLNALAEQNPAALAEFFTEVACLATVTNSRRILNHAMVPGGVAEQVEKTRAAWKAEAASKPKVVAVKPSQKAGTNEG